MSDTVLADLADKLAADTIAAMDRLGDDRLYEEVARVLGASSQTSEEAYMTSIRIRLAERRARTFLEEHVAKATAAQEAGEAPPPPMAPGSDADGL